MNHPQVECFIYPEKQVYTFESLPGNHFMMAGKIEKMLQDIARRIVPRFQPQRIILFGSHARGQANSDSDIDLLIVMDTESSNRSKANEIDLMLADRTMPVDIMVLTPEQYEQQK